MDTPTAKVNIETKTQHWRTRKQYTTQVTRLPHRGGLQKRTTNLGLTLTPLTRNRNPNSNPRTGSGYGPRPGGHNTNHTPATANLPETTPAPRIRSSGDDTSMPQDTAHGPQLAFTRYCFTLKAFCGSPSSISSPNLQSLHYCNTIARLMRNIRPPP